MHGPMNVKLSLFVYLRRICCKSKFKLYKKILQSTYTLLEQSWIPYRLVRLRSTHISYVWVMAVTSEAENSEVKRMRKHTRGQTRYYYAAVCTPVITL